MTADLLRRGIAWRLQEKMHGGLPKDVRREIDRLAREFARNGDVARKPAVSIKPGTWLVREWGGDSHHVLVLDQGYFYRERRFRSLSTIATEITGTRWSGPRFFGLRSAATRTSADA